MFSTFISGEILLWRRGFSRFLVNIKYKNLSGKSNIHNLAENIQLFQSTKLILMATIKISVINKYPDISDNEVERVMKAIQIQVKNDFSPIWGQDAEITFYRNNEVAPSDTWQLFILGTSNDADELGIHDLSKNKLPMGKVFAKTVKKKNQEWSVCASHEILEMLSDPYINKYAIKHNIDGTLVSYAYENCDACESDEYGYKIDVDGNAVLVSDFLFPAWFSDIIHPIETQFDKEGHIKSSFQILKNCYTSISNGNGLVQIYGEDTQPTYDMRAHVGSRRERRGIPQRRWLQSNC